MLRFNFFESNVSRCRHFQRVLAAETRRRRADVAVGRVLDRCRLGWNWRILITFLGISIPSLFYVAIVVSSWIWRSYRSVLICSCVIWTQMAWFWSWICLWMTIINSRFLGVIITSNCLILTKCFCQPLAILNPQKINKHKM